MQQVLSHIQLLCHSFVIIFTRKMIKFKAKVAPGLVYMKRLKYCSGAIQGHAMWRINL